MICNRMHAMKIFYSFLYCEILPTASVLLTMAGMRGKPAAEMLLGLKVLGEVQKLKYETATVLIFKRGCTIDIQP
jgi:hypothetical protein